MTENSKYFRLFFDNAPALYKLSDGEAGKLLKNICRMGRGEDLAPMNAKTAFAFDIYSAQLVRDLEYSERMAAIGSVGGKKNKRRLSDASQKESAAKQTITVTDTRQDETDTKQDDSSNTPDALLRACFNRRKIKLSERAWEWLKDRLGPEGLTLELVELAADKAVEHGAPNWAYTRKILNTWYEGGIRTPEDAEEETNDTGIFERPGSFDPKRGYE